MKKRILEVLAEKKNQSLLKEIANWIQVNCSNIDIKSFFAATFDVQLGVYIRFFATKNYYILATPNSYAIDYINCMLTEDTIRQVKNNLKQNGNPFILSKFDLGVNDIMTVYETALIDIIVLINKTPF